MDRFLVLDDKHMYGEGTSAAIYKQSLIEFAYIIGRGNTASSLQCTFSFVRSNRQRLRRGFSL